MDPFSYDYKLDPPDEPLCDCRAEDCEECSKLRAAEEAFERMIDRQIDEDKERRWDK